MKLFYSLTPFNILAKHREINVTVTNKFTMTPLKAGDGTAQTYNEALTETYKALKAITFYPENHPLREKILQKAYQAMVSIIEKDKLSLIVQRNGLSIADHEAVIDNTPMIMALAKELFTREIQRLTL